MEQGYGSDLFHRPDWEAAESTQIETLGASAEGFGLVAVSDGAVDGFTVATPDDATGLASVDIVAIRPAYSAAESEHC